MGYPRYIKGSVDYLLTHVWAVLVIGVVGLALYNFGIFSHDNSVGTHGFNHLKPLIDVPGVSGSDAVFTFANTNVVSITMDSGSSKITYQGRDCPVDFEPVIVPAGREFSVIAGNCAPAGRGGHFYEMELRYSLSIGGKTVTPSESGSFGAPSEGGEEPSEASTTSTSLAGVCGNGVLDFGEVCDSLHVDVCDLAPSFHPNGFVGGGACVGGFACRLDCTGCLMQEAECSSVPPAVCGDGNMDMMAGEVCETGQVAECPNAPGYYSDSIFGMEYCGNADLVGGCSFDCSSCISLPDCFGFTCGNGILEAGEKCDSGMTVECTSSNQYYSDAYVGDDIFCPASGGACQWGCQECIILADCNV